MADEARGEATSESQICPTCGTKNSEATTRCVVCGTSLKEPGGIFSARQRRHISLTLPAALILLVFFSLVSAGLTFAAMRLIPSASEQSTPTATSTQTPTQTSTPEPTFTHTPEPTYTPLPPIEYTIATGDSCVGLAFFYDVSVRSIIELNNLGVDCLLSVGTTILIPQPTPTNTPEPTATLSPAEATDAACEKMNYTVVANDTLSSIAENYSVSMQAIKEYNGMVSDTVLEGMTIIIPLCERISFGPTPTSTLPPPYPTPNLLLPQDGAAFSLANETITLQWASVGQLREGEYYQVVIEDITEGSGRRRVVDYVTDSKFIVPETFRPTETVPHIMRWWVTTVRQAGTTAGGNPSYQSAGSTSIKRSFTWSGAAPQTTPAP